MTTSTLWRTKLVTLLKRGVITLLVLIFWVALWDVLAHKIHQELLVPSPKLVVVTLWQLAKTAGFWQAVVASLWRIVKGFVGGVLVGTVLAVFTAKWAPAQHLFSPVLKIVRATPVASFIILALVWLKDDTLPAFIALLMVTPIVWANVDKGLRETDKQQLEMARLFRVGRCRTILHIGIPSVMPYFLTACTTALGLAWKSGIAAEVICRPDDSLGDLLQAAKLHLETAQVFAYTITVILLSVAVEQLFLFLIKRIGKRFNA